MEKKLSKIIGITKQEFDDHIKFNQIQVRQARLIPTSKTGDEISLSSVLLKTLSMVKEFKKQILSVCFGSFSERRLQFFHTFQKGFRTCSIEMLFAE